MFLPNLNITQEAQVLDVLFKSTASSVAPLMLLESFTIGMSGYDRAQRVAENLRPGVLCAFVPLASYLLWYDECSTAEGSCADKGAQG